MREPVVQHESVVWEGGQPPWAWMLDLPSEEEWLDTLAPIEDDDPAPSEQ